MGSQIGSLAVLLSPLQIDTGYIDHPLPTTTPDTQITRIQTMAEQSYTNTNVHIPFCSSSSIFFSI